MKSVQLIFEKFPAVQKKVERPNDPTVTLTNQEAVFYQMVQFFQNSKSIQFSLNMLYEHLKDEELLFALQVVVTFFQKDTTLVKDVSQNFYDLHLLREPIVGQKRFSGMVEENVEGMKFRPSMLHMYWQRRSEKIPRADLIIDGTPYWKVSAVEDFIDKEKEKRKNEMK